MKTTSIRNSTFELMRIISMFFIILYHLISYFIYPWSDNVIYKAIQIPLHIGVIVFVLISGYWGIKASTKGLLKFIFPIFIYYTGINLLYNILTGHYYLNLNEVLFISSSPYWFIRIYLYLYLLSPFINKFLESAPKATQLILLTILGFISLYMGTTNGDSSLSDGKNIINFTFLYIIGYLIRENRESIYQTKQTILISLYISLNFVIFISYLILYNTSWENIIWKWTFKYCSPLLIVNAILFFLIFSRVRPIKLKYINTISASVFSMYLIHEHTIIRHGIIEPILKRIYDLCINLKYPLEFSIILFAITIMCFCSVIHYLIKGLLNIRNILKKI